jgi:hypothetical protein
MKSSRRSLHALLQCEARRIACCVASMSCNQWWYIAEWQCKPSSSVTLCQQQGGSVVTCDDTAGTTALRRSCCAA